MGNGEWVRRKAVEQNIKGSRGVWQRRNLAGHGGLDGIGGWGFIARMSTKEVAHAAIEALPADATLQDAAEKLALLAALEKSRQSVKTGHWKPQSDVEKLLPQWLEK